MEANSSSALQSEFNWSKHLQQLTILSLHRTDWLDGKHVVFGKVIAGAEVVKKMEKIGSKAGTPSQKVTIYSSGELK
jgi:cyclophilin family peptidyl-prolyl cis-trans isomerase